DGDLAARRNPDARRDPAIVRPHGRGLAGVIEETGEASRPGLDPLPGADAEPVSTLVEVLVEVVGLAHAAHREEGRAGFHAVLRVNPYSLYRRGRHRQPRLRYRHP